MRHRHPNARPLASTTANAAASLPRRQPTQAGENKNRARPPGSTRRHRRLHRFNGHHDPRRTENLRPSGRAPRTTRNRPAPGVDHLRDRTSEAPCGERPQAIGSTNRTPPPKTTARIREHRRDELDPASAGPSDSRPVGTGQPFSNRALGGPWPLRAAIAPNRRTRPECLPGKLEPQSFVSRTEPRAPKTAPASKTTNKIIQNKYKTDIQRNHSA